MRLRSYTDKELKDEYLRLNERFFCGRLPKDARVRFRDLAAGGCTGTYNERTISVERAFRTFWSEARLTLLHEMAHLAMDLRGYVGHRRDGGHGGAFQVEIDRLYRAGAYDGIL